MFTKRSDRKVIKKGWAIEWLSHSILTTSLLQSWVYVLLFTAWATCIALICDKVQDLSFDNTLLGVFGTILGFIISFRTSSAFERYNEGKKLLSTIAYASRTFARIVWFHVPLEVKNADPLGGRRELEEKNAITAHADERPISSLKLPSDIIKEKRTALNLIEAFNIALKHHLREVGQKQDESEQLNICEGEKHAHVRPRLRSTYSSWASEATAREIPRLPGDVVIEVKPESTNENDQLGESDKPAIDRPSPTQPRDGPGISSRTPPKSISSTGNVPLEISFCLSSYIVTLQQRETDASITNNLLMALNQLVQSFTDLEKVSVDQIPYSYRFQLWSAAYLYIFFLPFQLWQKLKYISIPGTSIAALIFLGLLSAGEEIENPFNDDRNDLDMDRFCDDLGQELQGLMTPCVSSNSDKGELENRIDDVLRSVKLKDSKPTQK